MNSNDISLENIRKAHEVVINSLCVHTPVVKLDGAFFPELSKACDLYLKMENSQYSGSFKLRGVVNQLIKYSSTINDGYRPVTMSGGNYAKAFAISLKEKNIKGTVVMPNVLSENRINMIKELGMDTAVVPIGDLVDTVKRYEEDGHVYMHPFDDRSLITGYGSIVLELVNDLGFPPDVVVVPCGGGGLLSGIAVAVHHFKESTLVYGVEPENACTMARSLSSGRRLEDSTVHSVASGLMPPCVGHLTFDICQRHVSGMIQVSDKEIIHAMAALRHRGFFVEPSGAAGMAAILTEKLFKEKKVMELLTRGQNISVAVVLSGGNTSVSELVTLENNHFTLG